MITLGYILLLSLFQCIFDNHKNKAKTPKRPYVNNQVELIKKFYGWTLGNLPM